MEQQLAAFCARSVISRSSVENYMKRGLNTVGELR